MSVIFAEDFNSYGTNINFLLDGLYATVFGSLTADPDPNATGNVFQGAVQSLNGALLRRVFPTNYTTAGQACRLWMSRLPSTTAETPAFTFSDAGNNVQFWLTITTTGALQLRQGSVYATVLGSTTGPVITANAWHHIEFKAVASATVGTFEVRVNGVTVLTLAAINTGTQYSQFRLDNPNSIGTTLLFYVKDLVLWNTAGARNNDFMGSVSVIALPPNSDVSLNWAPTPAGNGFSILDNSPPIDATAYITAVTPPPAPAVFGLTDLPLNVTSVRALITKVRARKSDGGDGNLQSGLISSGDNTLGTDRAITTAFTYYDDVFETDPHTAAAWTPASANAAQLRLNRTV